MRQAGMLAVCLQVAMEDWQEKLLIDNDNCAWMARAINDIDGVSVNLESVHTNMFSFSLDSSITGLGTANGPSDEHLSHAELCQLMKEKHDVMISPAYFSNNAIRIVTHRDVSRSEMEFVVEKL